MSISSTRTFDLNRSQIVDMALADVGALRPGETTTTQQAKLRTDANYRLNALVEELAVYGIYLWRRIRRTATLTVSTATFSPASDVWAIDGDMDLLPSGETTRRPITRITAAEYMLLPDRTQTGEPVNFIVEETIGSSGVALTVTLYPVPDSADTVEYIAYLKAATFSTDAITGDFPAKWLRCLRYGLAMELSPGHRVPDGRLKFFKSEYEQAKAELVADNGENVAMRLVPRG